MLQGCSSYYSRKAEQLGLATCGRLDLHTSLSPSTFPSLSLLSLSFPLPLLPPFSHGGWTCTPLPLLCPFFPPPCPPSPFPLPSLPFCLSLSFPLPSSPPPFSLGMQWGGNQSPMYNVVGVLSSFQPQAPSLRAVVRASLQPTVSPCEPGSQRCFAQCTSSHLPPPGAKKPGRLQAPAQFTIVYFCSAFRLQRHVL